MTVSEPCHFLKARARARLIEAWIRENPNSTAIVKTQQRVILEPNPPSQRMPLSTSGWILETRFSSVAVHPRNSRRPGLTHEKLPRGRTTERGSSGRRRTPAEAARTASAVFSKFRLS